MFPPLQNQTTVPECQLLVGQELVQTLQLPELSLRNTERRLHKEHVRCGRLAFRQTMEGKREDITDKPQAKTSSKSLLPTRKFLDFKVQSGGKKPSNIIIQQACPTSLLFPLLFHFSFTLFYPIFPQRISPRIS